MRLPHANPRENRCLTVLIRVDHGCSEPVGPCAACHGQAHGLGGLLVIELVHVYSKSLEYAFFKNVPVGDFVQLIDANNGFEGVRKLAASELPKTQQQLDAATERANEAAKNIATFEKLWALKQSRPIARFPLPASRFARPSAALLPSISCICTVISRIFDIFIENGRAS